MPGLDAVARRRLARALVSFGLLCACFLQMRMG
jgi:hypothetical protein